MDILCNTVCVQSTIQETRDTSSCMMTTTDHMASIQNKYFSSKLYFEKVLSVIGCWEIKWVFSRICHFKYLNATQSVPQAKTTSTASEKRHNFKRNWFHIWTAKKRSLFLRVSQLKSWIAPWWSWNLKRITQKYRFVRFIKKRCKTTTFS